MKTGFRDPITPKHVKPPHKPVDGKNSPWDYRAPQYDQRSSCFVSAGDSYGVGHRQPVGHKGIPKDKVIPTGRVDTLRTYEER